MKKIAAFALTLAMLLALVACGSTANNTTTETAPAASAASSNATAGTAPAASTEPGDPVYASDDKEFILNTGDWVIGVSNSYYGNQWRKSMAESFERVAEEAKQDGLIADYEIQNGDGTVNNQIAQINTFILEGVDAILIDPGSTTALNNVLQEAIDAGIVVVSFDGEFESDAVHQIVFPFYPFGYERIEDMIRILGTDELNVVVVRGLEGSPPEEGMYQGSADAMKEHPNIKVLATVWGDFSATKTQEELLKIIPSLSEHVDAVVTQCGGDAYGAVMAFETYYDDDEMPLIIGDNGAEFVDWWAAYSEAHPDFETRSFTTPPTVIQCAFWAALYELNGGDLPMSMIGPLAYLEQDEVAEWAGKLTPGSVYSPDYDAVWTWENVIKPSK